MKIKNLILVILLISKCNVYSFPVSQILDDSFYNLVNVWAREREKMNGGWEIEWLDFSANQQLTKEICENQGIEFRLKGCKSEIHHKEKALEIDYYPYNIEEKKSVVYQYDYVNNNNVTDEISLKKDFFYFDNYIINNENVHPVNNEVSKVWIHIPLKKNDVNENFKWSPSEGGKQGYEKSKELNINENFIIPPFNKANVILSLYRLEYELKFNTYVSIEGFFSYKQKDGWLPWNKGKTFVLSVHEPILQIKSNSGTYTKYLYEMTKNYQLYKYEENGYFYDNLNYIIRGKINGKSVYKTEIIKNITKLDENFIYSWVFKVTGISIPFICVMFNWIRISYYLRGYREIK